MMQASRSARSSRRMAAGVLVSVFSAAILLLSGARAAEQPVDWPLEWTAFGPVRPDGPVDIPDMAALVPEAQMTSVPERLEIQGEVFEGKAAILPNGIVVDLEQVLGQTQRLDAVYLFGKVTALEEADITIGSGSDWYMKWWLDGEPLYDTLTLGNEAYPISVNDHTFTAHLSPGEHVLTACVVRGRTSFAFVAGRPGQSRAQDRPAHLPAVRRAAYRRLLEDRALEPELRIKTHHEIAKTYLEEENYEAARAEYDTVLTAASSEEVGRFPHLLAKTHLEVAGTYMEEDNYAQARQAYEQVLSMNATVADHALARLGVGKTYLCEGDHEAAATQYTKVLQALSKEDRRHQISRSRAESKLRILELIPRIRRDHPRLFMNNEMWPGMRERALGPGRSAYEEMQQVVDSLPPINAMGRRDWGRELAPSAFVYRMTNDAGLLAKIKRMLRASFAYYSYVYDRCEVWEDARRYGVSHVPNRMSCLAALDWIWNDLDPAERAQLGSGMVDSVYRHLLIYPTRSRGWHGSFYTADNLYWYTGLTLLEEDLDKAASRRVLELLEEGYNDHMKMLDSRKSSRQDDGALQPRLAYTLPAYPHAEWKFFHAWRAAIGPEIPQAWQHSALMPNHAFWNLLPPAQPGQLPREFGLGQAWHNPGYMTPTGWMRAFGGYLAQHIYFYEDSHPGMANLSRFLWQRMGYLRAGKYGSIPFWSEIWSPLEERGGTLPEGLPLARHFAGNGTVLMRTGSGRRDTYALFNAGGGVSCSPQFDSTHFAIYKGGFLALDSGTRQSHPHMESYYSHTVAHNAVLIRMPGETFRGMYGRDTTSNAGGQYRRPGYAKALAFETRPLFAYAASDATATYHPDKCAQMVRQFLFLAPNHFVVFDRVRSQKADYPKKWLLHTSNEPTVTGSTFRADQAEGRLFCRTLAPSDATLAKIGGPGKEFWADGRNWPLSDDWWNTYTGALPAGQRRNRVIPEMMGRWRVEVHPGAAREQDVFLHLIQVADQSVEEMVESSVRETEDRIELTFSVGARTYTIALNKTGSIGGHIRIEEGGEVLVDRALTQEVMPQAGLALVE